MHCLLTHTVISINGYFEFLFKFRRGERNRVKNQLLRHQLLPVTCWWLSNCLLNNQFCWQVKAQTIILTKSLSCGLLFPIFILEFYQTNQFNKHQTDLKNVSSFFSSLYWLFTKTSWVETICMQHIAWLLLLLSFWLRKELFRKLLILLRLAVKNILFGPLSSY